ncbi:CoaE-domain-containing protein [Fomitiporia mediterranea MF3/22]|uniref:CoaE-domain-containing protein n=1 Tax=Fomitiporia mediterranea (strain MF3/22) TaxID=694068 RepID=UPI00044075D6|nr:CoaE-domain-containing protein [Fomitiporia mediterranea MF3/22]EJD05876.1 CoaE-domain-containing protein [Fomitiporia mediterranea MF3/22]
MLVVGLTGGIATGKSTVSSLLKSQYVPVIDADVIAREVVQPGRRAHREIVEYFGEDILLPNGGLDRPKLGAAIFGDEGKRKKLNSIVHPAVRREMAWQVAKAWVRGHRYCVIDVPLLIETGLNNWVGLVVVVSCPEATQLQRLVGRDNLSEEAATARFKSQMPIAAKARYADIVIDNSGTFTDLKGRVNKLVQQLESKTRWTWLLEWIIPPIGIVSGVLTLIVRRFSRMSEHRKQK